jgi:DNA-binding NtrC family response regulator
MPQRALIVAPDDTPRLREVRRWLHLALDRNAVEVVAVGELAAATRWLDTAPCDVAFAAAPMIGDLLAATGGTLPLIALCDDLPAALVALDAGASDGLVGEVSDTDLVLALRRAVHRASGRGRNGANGTGANGHGHGHGTGVPVALASADDTAQIPALAAHPSDGGAGASVPMNVRLGRPAEPHVVGAKLIGDSAPMRELRTTIGRIAGHRTTVLITGESGTGKELVARALHDASPRAKRPFIAINCAAIPGPLLESELFGHKRGAFTDAVRDKPGLFEEAEGGTLFLDEVGELPLGLQSKLLRALQESEIRRVGDTASVKVDVRLVAATLRDLATEAKAGRFREDLYYRLAVLPISVPPLRERPDDVPMLVAHFVARFGERHGHAAGFTPDAIAALAARPWQGNVRELENAVERALVLAEGPTIDAAQLALLLGGRLRAASPDPRELAPPSAPDPTPPDLSIKKATRSLEAELIRRALEQTGGNRTNAARLLEISHRALLYKLKEYGIN